MSTPPMPRIEINGRDATSRGLRVPATVNYGHYTAMQVRGGRVRGLELHLRRLDAATQELFGADLDRQLTRDHIRHAIGDDARDASVRVDVFWPEADDVASVMVAVRPPTNLTRTPQSLQAVAYQRPLAHIKHVGSFAQIHYRRLAERNGFDDALLTGPGGVISEGAIANIGFFDGAALVWPDAPALHGTTMQLLEQALADRLPSRRSAVRLADLPDFGAVFVTNSNGIAPVARVDGLALPVDTELMKTLAEAYDAVPWDAF